MHGRKEIEEELARLREKLEELGSSIPAHSTKPHHVMQMEDLEDQIEALERLLDEMG